MWNFSRKVGENTQSFPVRRKPDFPCPTSILATESAYELKNAPDEKFMWRGKLRMGGWEGVDFLHKANFSILKLINGRIMVIDGCKLHIELHTWRCSRLWIFQWTLQTMRLKYSMKKD